MTPSHTNKQGARYRYYVSHAILQKRKDEAGTITRVPAHEIETAVIEAIRQRLSALRKMQILTTAGHMMGVVGDVYVETTGTIAGCATASARS